MTFTDYLSRQGHSDPGQSFHSLDVTEYITFYIAGNWACICKDQYLINLMDVTVKAEIENRSILEVVMLFFSGTELWLHL